MAWQSGPLPPDTYFWGAVITKDMTSGFLFADFCGDHALSGESRIEAADVLFYDNSLRLHPRDGYGGGSTVPAMRKSGLGG